MATSQITLYDGTTTVNIDGYASLGLEEAFSPVSGGSTVTRFIAGNAIKQSSYSGIKWAIRINGKGWVPSGLWGLDYTQEMTLTVKDPIESGGTKQYTVFASLSVETWDINAATMNWSLQCEEV